MNALRKIAAVAVAAVTLAGLAGEAQAYTLWTKNSSKNAIWITIYLYGGHNGKQDYLCSWPGRMQK